MQALVLNVMTGYSGGEGRCHVSCEAVGLFFLRGGGAFIRYILLECLRMWSFAPNVEWDANTQTREI